MHKFLFATIFSLWLLIGTAAFAEKAVDEQIPDAQVVGSGRFDYLFMHIYDIQLIAPKGVYASDQPFALTLTYQRDLKGSDIAEESINQMRKQGLKDAASLAKWQKAMTDIFPDVSKGVSLTGIRMANGQTLFTKNGEIIGQVDDPAFSDAFFNIWLSSKTTEPALRAGLLGEKG